MTEMQEHSSLLCQVVLLAWYVQCKSRLVIALEFNKTLTVRLHYRLTALGLGADLTLPGTSLRAAQYAQHPPS